MRGQERVDFTLDTRRVWVTPRLTHDRALLVRLIDDVALCNDAAKLADDSAIRHLCLECIFAIAIRTPLLIQLYLECRLLFLTLFLVIWSLVHKLGHYVLLWVLLCLLLFESFELFVLLLLGFVDAGQRDDWTLERGIVVVWLWVGVGGVCEHFYYKKIIGKL